MIDRVSQAQIDSIQVVFWIKNFYYSSDFSQKVQQNYQISKKIPPQISLDNLSQANAIALAITITMSVIFGSSMILNIFLSQGAQMLWGMIEGFQLISHLPMTSIIIPANTLSFFGLLNDIASFNLIPVDDLSNDLFDFTEMEYSAFNDHFEFMNYSSSNLIHNIGLLFYFMVLNFVILFIGLIIQMFGFHRKRYFNTFKQLWHLVQLQKRLKRKQSIIKFQDLQWELSQNFLCVL